MQPSYLIQPNITYVSLLAVNTSPETTIRTLSDAPRFANLFGIPLNKKSYICTYTRKSQLKNLNVLKGSRSVIITHTWPLLNLFRWYEVLQHEHVLWKLNLRSRMPSSPLGSYSNQHFSKRPLSNYALCKL